MRHVWCQGLLLLFVSASAASADTAPPTKAPPPSAAAKPSPFDVEFGAQAVSDYVYRGFSITSRKPTVQGYARAVYHGFYAGMQATPIDVPFRAPAVLDFYAGHRMPLGPVLLENRVNYYHFPDSVVPNTNTPGKFDYWEIQTRPMWTVNDSLLLFVHAAYAPSFINLGASQTWLSGIAVLKGPLPQVPGWGGYISGELGHQWMGTNNSNVNIPDYFAWNLGVGLVHGPLTFDIRYFDSSMTREECWIMTGDHRALPGGVPSPGNPFGLRSNWCGATLVGKVAFDLTASKLGLFK